MEEGEGSLAVLLHSPLSLRWVTALEFATNECYPRSVEAYKAPGVAVVMLVLATAGHRPEGSPFRAGALSLRAERVWTKLC